MKTEIINSILRKHKCKKLYYRLTEHYKNKLFTILSNINKVEGDRNEIFYKIFYDYRLNKEVTYDIEGNKIFDYYITKNLTNKITFKTN